MLQSETYRPRVYVAGPYASAPGANTRRACEAADALLAAGCVPFVPHATGYAWSVPIATRTDPGRERTDREWLEWCCEWIGHCDAVIRLDGESPGADTETALARMYGLPVFADVKSCIEWRDSQARLPALVFDSARAIFVAPIGCEDADLEPDAIAAVYDALIEKFADPDEWECYLIVCWGIDLESAIDGVREAWAKIPPNMRHLFSYRGRTQ